MIKIISLETSDVLFSNSIFFILYNLHYIAHGDDLDLRVSLINRIEISNYRTTIS